MTSTASSARPLSSRQCTRSRLTELRIEGGTRSSGAPRSSSRARSTSPLISAPMAAMARSATSIVGMLTRARDGLRPLRELDEPDDVAAHVRADRGDDDGHDLAVGVAALAEPRRRRVGVDVGLPIGEVERLTQRRPQELRLGCVRAGPVEHLAPRPHHVDRQRGDVAADDLHGDPGQRVDVLVGHGEGAGPGQVAAGDELARARASAGRRPRRAGARAAALPSTGRGRGTAVLGVGHERHRPRPVRRGRRRRR